jgi:hypothetical protein
VYPNCECTLYCLYFDLYIKFDDLFFEDLNVFETFINKNTSMHWCINMNGEELDCFIKESASFYFFYQPMLSCNKLFKTSAKARLLFCDGSCEIELWRIYQKFSGWTRRQILKPWTNVYVECDEPIILR